MMTNFTIDWVEWRWDYVISNPQITFNFEWNDGVEDKKAIPGSPLGIGITERRALPLNPCSATGDNNIGGTNRARKYAV